MKDILVFAPDGTKMGEFNSMKEASEKTGVPYKSVKRCIDSGEPSTNGYTFDEMLEERA